MANDSSNAPSQEQPPEPNPALKRLDALAGEWNIGGSHRLYPGATAGGRTTLEWLEGEHFLVQRWEADHPDFPSGIAIIGCDALTERCSMHYFDSRGISRVYEMSVSDGVWKIWRDSPGFSQRFTGTFSDDGNTITGSWQISSDGSNWEHDFDLTYMKT